MGKKINSTDAAKLLGLSVRQIKRIKAMVLELKLKGVIHGNRGHGSNNKTKEETAERTKRLLRSKLPANMTFLPCLYNPHQYLYKKI